MHFYDSTSRVAVGQWLIHIEKFQESGFGNPDLMADADAFDSPATNYVIGAIAPDVQDIC